MRLQQKIREADDRRQHVVEVVRDAAREIADSLHLLSLRDTPFERLLLRRIDHIERRGGTALHGSERRHINAARKLLLLARRNFDRLDVAATGQRLGKPCIDEDALLRLRRRAKSFSGKNVLRGFAVENHPHEGGVAMGDAAFGVERRNAERRRLEKLRCAHILLAAVDEARRKPIDRCDREPLIRVITDRLDEQCESDDAAVLTRQIQVDDTLIGFRNSRHELQETETFRTRKLRETELAHSQSAHRIPEPMLESGIDVKDCALG